MEIFVEHHNWRWNKKKGWWSGSTTKIFKNKKSFDSYVLNQKEKYPHADITYYIYEHINNDKGAILAHLEYNGRQFNGLCINSKWNEFASN